MLEFQRRAFPYHKWWDKFSTILVKCFDLALANTVPSWINVKHPKVDPKRAIYYSVAIALFLYIAIGLIGSFTYDLTNDTNLLQAMYSDTKLSSGGKGWMTIMFIIFPLLTYVSSIPISMIVARLNFLAAKLLNAKNANFCAVYLPFLIGIPFQTGSLITSFGTWTSLTFQSLCNFFAPFLIFLFLSRRRVELQQSVLDEVILVYEASISGSCSRNQKDSRRS